jgi:CheY-like chemotaxis protein
VRRETAGAYLKDILGAKPNQSVILVADDEVLIRSLIRQGLEAAGYFVLTASDGEQAMDLSRKFPSSIHALITDVIMPKLDGIALRRQILGERPEIRVLLMSGQTAQEIPQAAPFLRKPFRVGDLRKRLRQLLVEPSSTC